MSHPRVGVLSLQGDFACHRATLEALGAGVARVTLPQDLAACDALVIPGGESTTMLRLLAATGLRAPLEAFARSKPVLGTCAGVIVLGRGGEGLPAPALGALDVQVERNAYGRQIDSFTADVDVAPLGRSMQGMFIRAPRLTAVGAGVSVIARLAAAHGAAPAGEPVGVRAGHVVGLCFHPELTHDAALHQWFLEEVAGFTLPAASAEAGHGRAPGSRA